MYIYRIVNVINKKCYIGQTIRPIEQRFKRHILVKDINTNKEKYFNTYRACERYYGLNKRTLQSFNALYNESFIYKNLLITILN